MTDEKQNSSSAADTAGNEEQVKPEAATVPQETKTEDQKPAKNDFSNLKPGMTVKVHQKIQEIGKKGEPKERIQIFEGMIIALRGAGISKTMTVRKVSDGVGVEKILPLSLPTIAKIEPVKQAKVSRAKLYYLRDYKKKLKEKKI
ncbi:MAG: 50S ribosomal protein L19 [Patescibacteria group bacterium]